MSALRHFGLTRDPFAAGSDPTLFVPTLGHEDAIERLTFAIRERRGLSMMLGERGLGKSTVKAAVLHELLTDESLVIGTIDDPRAGRTDVQFLRAVLAAFGVPATGRTGLDLTTEFRRYVAAASDAGQSVLLVIDDAQHLASSHLESLRTFLSFDGPGAPQLSIVLVAEPALEEKITRKRNLAQRVGVVHRLNPLNRRDTAKVITERVARAGWRGALPLFDDEAIVRIYDHSDGIPAEIITLGRECLAETAERNHDRVTGDTVRAVVARRDGAGQGTQLTLLGEPLPTPLRRTTTSRRTTSGAAPDSAVTQTRFVASATTSSRGDGTADRAFTASQSPQRGGEAADTTTFLRVTSQDLTIGVSHFGQNFPGIYIEGADE